MGLVLEQSRTSMCALKIPARLGQSSGPGIAGSWQRGAESASRRLHSHPLPQPGQLLQGTSGPAGLQRGRVPWLAAGKGGEQPRGGTPRQSSVAVRSGETVVGNWQGMALIHLQPRGPTKKTERPSGGKGGPFSRPAHRPGAEEACESVLN